MDLGKQRANELQVLLSIANISGEKRATFSRWTDGNERAGLPSPPHDSPPCKHIASLGGGRTLRFLLSGANGKAEKSEIRETGFAPHDPHV